MADHMVDASFPQRDKNVPVMGKELYVISEPTGREPVLTREIK
jgi:hypothetical protein